MLALGPTQVHPKCGQSQLGTLAIQELVAVQVPVITKLPTGLATLPLVGNGDGNPVLAC